MANDDLFKKDVVFIWIMRIIMIILLVILSYFGPYLLSLLKAWLF